MYLWTADGEAIAPFAIYMLRETLAETIPLVIDRLVIMRSETQEQVAPRCAVTPPSASTVPAAFRQTYGNRKAKPPQRHQCHQEVNGRVKSSSTQTRCKAVGCARRTKYGSA